MPKTLKEQIMGKCRHFNGTMNAKCEVGIAYETVKTLRGPGKGMSLPCLLHADAKPCDQCSPKTETEADRGRGGRQRSVVDCMDRRRPSNCSFCRR